MRTRALKAVVAAMVTVAVVTLGSGGVSAEPVALAQTPRWAWPLHPVSVVRGFEAPPTPYAAGHRGLDLAAGSGTPVYAPADGIVYFVGTVVDRPVVTLDHGGGVLSSYEPVAGAGSRASALEVGATVPAGESIGVVASGGHCDARCLHVGVRIDGAYVSPLLFFDRIPRAVLLPLQRAVASTGGPAHARGWAIR
ncbi:murein hydrolase activator EnvC family protein [Leifsonia sp. NPDC058230]|uniref:murein hydrolase activator EnvC family protein n=1 Tax=Leifsonia sp. NPDC058230 TaxID=3346391 RepID=UPI0036D7F765